MLIVEDDATARRAISLLLRGRGFAVSEAATLADAMAAIVARPRWVLLDIMLPDGSGLDVLRRIRTDGLGCRVCVISGCHAHVLREAAAMGADLTLPKPLDIERLIDAIRE